MKPETNTAKKIIVTGAAGPVGSFVVQLARQAGADTIAMGDERNREFLVDLGAQIGDSANRDNWKDADGMIVCKSITDYEARFFLGSLKSDGKVIVVPPKGTIDRGMCSDEFPGLVVEDLQYRWADAPGMLGRLREYLGHGGLKKICQPADVFDSQCMQDWRDALARMQTNRHGKVVLRMNHTGWDPRYAADYICLYGESFGDDPFGLPLGGDPWYVNHPVINSRLLPSENHKPLSEFQKTFKKWPLRRKTVGLIGGLYALRQSFSDQLQLDISPPSIEDLKAVHAEAQNAQEDVTADRGLVGELKKELAKAFSVFHSSEELAWILRAWGKKQPRNLTLQLGVYEKKIDTKDAIYILDKDDDPGVTVWIYHTGKYHWESLKPNDEGEVIDFSRSDRPEAKNSAPQHDTSTIGAHPAGTAATEAGLLSTVPEEENLSSSQHAETLPSSPPRLEEETVSQPKDITDESGGQDPQGTVQEQPDGDANAQAEDPNTEENSTGNPAAKATTEQPDQRVFGKKRSGEGDIGPASHTPKRRRPSLLPGITKTPPGTKRPHPEESLDQADKHAPKSSRLSAEERKKRNREHLEWMKEKLEIHRLMRRSIECTSRNRAHLLHIRKTLYAWQKEFRILKQAKTATHQGGEDPSQRNTAKTNTEAAKAQAETAKDDESQGGQEDGDNTKSKGANQKKGK